MKKIKKEICERISYQVENKDELKNLLNYFSPKEITFRIENKIKEDMEIYFKKNNHYHLITSFNNNIINGWSTTIDFNSININDILIVKFKNKFDKIK